MASTGARSLFWTVQRHVSPPSAASSLSSTVAGVAYSNEAYLSTNHGSSSSRSMSSAPAQQARSPAVKQLSADESRNLVMTAQSKVFGTVFGDNLRSGRKRLRALLKGPRKRNYYGYNFDDIMPTMISTMKEDFFRDEELLNRVGKTRIKGKVKEPLKDMVQAMKFEDIQEDLTNDNTASGRPEDFLLAEEANLRTMQLQEAGSSEEAAAIDAHWVKLVAYRERHFPELVKFTQEAMAKEGMMPESSGRDEPEVKFRKDLDDRRLQGEDDDSPSAGKVDKSEGSPALDTDAPGAAAGTLGNANEGSDIGAGRSEAPEELTSFSVKDLADDPDPIVRGLARAQAWNVDVTLLDDPSLVARSTVESSYKEWATARAAATWAALETCKDDPWYRGAYEDWEGALVAVGATMSKEGLTKWMLENADERRAAEVGARQRVK